MSVFTATRNWAEVRGRRYVTTKPLAWEIGAKGSGLWLRVPPGFVFDVSIPWVFRWWLHPADERFLKAACLHDYALGSLHWDRVTSAAAFSEALRAEDVPRLTRLIMVLAVIVWKWR